MKKIRLSLLIAATSLFINIEKSFACYPCSILNVSKMESLEAGSSRFSLSERYISYDQAQDLAYAERRDNEFVRSFSITQIGYGYAVTDRLELDIYLPVIHRRADSVEALDSEKERDFGIGDLVLASNLKVYDDVGDNWSVDSGFTFGVKLPTGDTDRISDEVNTRHHPAVISGSANNLVFGTGSTDLILGFSAIANYEKLLALATFQYTFRTEGEDDYKFADDIIGMTGLGHYLLMEDDYSLALAAMLSAEKKPEDSVGAQTLNGTEYFDLYVGPSALVSLGTKLSGELGFDFKVNNQSQGAIITPDWRLKFDLAYKF